MITLRHASERGHANHGWLDSFHSFSFADYYDPAHMGYSSLRVINEDRVQPGMGFGTHGHRDMEIVSYVLDGALEHKDSMGTGSVIVPGDVQRMSAGRGVMHSEFNASRERVVHFLQIWIEPATRGLAPSYEQANVPSQAKRGRLALIAGPAGSGAAVTIHQDAKLYATLLDGEERVQHALAPGRRAYVHVARGSVRVNGTPLTHGDAAKLDGEPTITLDRGDAAEVLLFDLP
ncbi:MAG: pirin family protein [Betaproteobacteria bacterium]|jgi:redox-sensitive bicupin YhaK (pirin superfamily)|nr:pirin family protein [Betaproteobacteria bacterium]